MTRTVQRAVQVVNLSYCMRPTTSSSLPSAQLRTGRRDPYAAAYVRGTQANTFLDYRHRDYGSLRSQGRRSLELTTPVGQLLPHLVHQNIQARNRGREADPRRFLARGSVIPWQQGRRT